MLRCRTRNKDIRETYIHRRLLLLPLSSTKSIYFLSEIFATTTSSIMCRQTLTPCRCGHAEFSSILHCDRALYTNRCWIAVYDGRQMVAEPLRALCSYCIWIQHQRHASTTTTQPAIRTPMDSAYASSAHVSPYANHSASIPTMDDIDPRLQTFESNRRTLHSSPLPASVDYASYSSPRAASLAVSSSAPQHMAPPARATTVHATGHHLQGSTEYPVLSSTVAPTENAAAVSAMDRSSLGWDPALWNTFDDYLSIPFEYAFSESM